MTKQALDAALERMERSSPSHCCSCGRPTCWMGRGPPSPMRWDARPQAERARILVEMYDGRPLTKLATSGSGFRVGDTLSIGPDYDRGHYVIAQVTGATITIGGRGSGIQYRAADLCSVTRSR